MSYDRSALPSEEEARLKPGSLTVYRRRAMGSDFEVAVNESGDADRESFAADASLAALDEVDRVEEILSVFRPHSTISRLNLLAPEMDVRVDEELWGWLETSLRLSVETEGAFDVACAPLWRAWGFAKRDGEFPSKEKLAAALRLSGARHLRLDSAARSVAFDESGVELNFGAIGKGIALDCAATILENEGLGSFLLQGGKSGVIARGGRKNDFSFATSALIRGASTHAPTHEEDDEIDEESGLRRRRRGSTQKDAQIALDALLPDFGDDAFFEPPSNEPVGWTIGVSHPLHPDRRLAELWLRDKALATSGSTWQFFRSGGKRYSHIIDPRTGYPSFGVLSATVLAPTATEADALSTAFFVAGATFTESYCAKRKDVAAFLVLEKGESGGYELASFNFEPGTLRLVDGR